MLQSPPQSASPSLAIIEVIRAQTKKPRKTSVRFCVVSAAQADESQRPTMFGACSTATIMVTPVQWREITQSLSRYRPRRYHTGPHHQIQATNRGKDSNLRVSEGSTGASAKHPSLSIRQCYDLPRKHTANMSSPICAPMPSYGR